MRGADLGTRVLRRLSALVVVVFALVAAGQAGAATVTVGTFPKGADPVFDGLVDAAGTIHLVYGAAFGSSTDSETLNYCRLARAATSCASSATLTPSGALDSGFSGPGTGDTYNEPTPLDFDNQLLIAQGAQVFPAVSDPNGDGGSSQAPTLLYSSEDGGQTFTGPADVGSNGTGTLPYSGLPDVGGDAVVYNGTADPQIGTLGYFLPQTEGNPAQGDVYFQSIAPGAFSSSGVDLSGEAPSGTAWIGIQLAVDGTEPLVAYVTQPSNDADTINLREYSGTAPIDDASNWSDATIAGSQPQIVSGPSGVWMLFFTPQKQWAVVRLVDGSPSGSPVVLTAAGIQTSGLTLGAQRITIGESLGGELMIAYGLASMVTPAGDQPIDMITSTDGSTWTAPQTLAASGGGYLGAPVAASDGGGFLPYLDFTSGGDVLQVATFGTQAPTKATGLGGLAGGGTTGGGGGGGGGGTHQNCTDAKFGAVDIVPLGGCFLQDPSHKGSLYSEGLVLVNGVTLAPDAGTRIDIDTAAHTIKSSGGVTAELCPNPSECAHSPTGNVPIWHGQLNITVPDAAVGAALFQLPTSGLSLEGFPILGDIDASITAGDGVDIPLTLGLPPWALGATASDDLQTNNGVGLSVNSLNITVPDIPLAALELKNIDISYDASSDTWTGSGEIDVPEGSGYFSAELAMVFSHGDLRSASLVVKIPPPGIPVYTDVYIHEFFGGFSVEPFSLTIGGRVGLYAPVPKVDYPIDLKGTLNATFGPPDVFTLQGDLYVVGVHIATAALQIGFDPFSFDIGASVNLFDLVTGSIHFGVHPKQTPLWDGEGDVSFARLFDIDAYISSEAISACASVKVGHAGFIYYWGGKFSFFGGLGGCDFPQPQPVPVSITPVLGSIASRDPVARAASAGFTVASGTSVEDVEVSSSTGTPAVTLQSPSGQTITPAPVTGTGSEMQIPSGPAAVLSVPGSDEAVVMLEHPAAGSWTVSQAPGSPPITSVEVVRGYPDPVLHVKLTPQHVRLTGRNHRHAAAKQRSYTLHYSLTRRPGVTVSFIESGPGIDRVIRTVPGGSGTVALTPERGPGGRRKIYALVQDHGEPLMRPLVGSFTEPRPHPPARVSDLRVVRRGRDFAVSFGSTSGASQFLVRVNTSDGRGLYYNLGAGAHRLSIPAFGLTDTIHVTVTPKSALGLSARPTVASARYIEVKAKTHHRHKRKKHRKK